MIAGLVLFVGIVVVVAAYAAYRKAFYVSPDRAENLHALPPGEQFEEQAQRMHEMIDAIARVPCERVTIHSRDGLRLTARYYPGEPGAPLDIEFHGYRSMAQRDFSGGIRIGRGLGHGVLLVDQRAHGQSEGRVITFGVKERFDCLSWAEYAAKRFGPDTKIFLIGVSMGAATVLMASNLPLPANVAGIIADCPYSAPDRIIKKVCRDMGLPPALAYPFAALGARLFGHFSPGDASALTAVRHARVPVLLLHGEDDRFVPVEMSFEIRDACLAPVTLLTFPGAGHGLSYLQDTARYEQAVKDFMRSA